MTAPADYLRLALDPVRLAILGAAATDDLDAETLAGRLGVSHRRVLEGIGRLREAGVIDADLRLDGEALQDIARRIPQEAPAAEEIAGGEWTAEEAAVLLRFFSGSRLTEIPSARGKRRIVLERLAQEFEPGLRYPEKQVNFTLQLYHQDYAALRRYLVDEGFLTRVDGVYWRTGGRYGDAPHS